MNTYDEYNKFQHILKKIERRHFNAKRNRAKIIMKTKNQNKTDFYKVYNKH